MAGICLVGQYSKCHGGQRSTCKCRKVNLAYLYGAVRARLHVCVFLTLCNSCIRSQNMSVTMSGDESRTGFIMAREKAQSILITINGHLLTTRAPT